MRVRWVCSNALAKTAGVLRGNRCAESLHRCGVLCRMRTSPLAVKSLVSSCCTSAVSLGIVLTSLPHHPLGYSPPLPSASALQAEPEAQRSRSQGCAGSRGSRPSPLRPIVVTGLGSPRACAGNFQVQM